jgi:hypothetical protein
MFYLPTIVLFMLAFFVLLVLLFALIMVGTISYAFDKVGLDPGASSGSCWRAWPAAPSTSRSTASAMSRSAPITWSPSLAFGSVCPWDRRAKPW